jgi:hypothetical protein
MNDSRHAHREREERFARLWKEVDGDIVRVSDALANDTTCPWQLHYLAALGWFCLFFFIYLAQVYAVFQTLI